MYMWCSDIAPQFGPILSEQISWVKANDFMGVMIWALDLDDFTGGFCNEGAYPLITEINVALHGDIPTLPPYTSVIDFLLSLSAGHSRLL